VFSILSTRIKQCAIDSGFDVCGIAPIRDFCELKVFPQWIADGKHGEMKYMEARDQAGDLKREALSRVAPWAKSVIVCAVNYNTAHPYSIPSDHSANDSSNSDSSADHATSQGWISRYAWGGEDYHDSVLRRLRKTEDALGEIFRESFCGSKADSNEACADQIQLRSYVDTGPLIERVYAKYAGIGWIAKNTCIINQELGSWLFLGVILTSLDVLKSDRVGVTSEANSLVADFPAPDRCGSCTRCIDACPTQAITAPGELDARLCISYLTIEKRGGIPEELRSAMGRHVFGCDICQDVCPWNRKAPVASAAEFQPREGLVNPSLAWLAEMPPEEFQTVFRGSPVKRGKLAGLRRNAVIAMGNSGDEKFISTLEKLAEDPDPVVAEHARWALPELRRTFARIERGLKNVPEKSAP
jgi:epoxyqueuosine reductase